MSPCSTPGRGQRPGGSVHRRLGQLALATRARHLSALRSALAWWAEAGWVTADPTAGWARPKVPVDYFAPLAGLRTGPETELYFALGPYYPARQAAGTTARQVARIDTHLASSPAGSREWGICTECGMGRVQAGDVPALLDLHRTVLDSHGANR